MSNSKPIPNGLMFLGIVIGLVAAWAYTRARLIGRKVVDR